MSILLAKEIKQFYKEGLIKIEPFNEDNLAVNSIDVTLSSKLITYEPIDIIWSEKYQSYIVQKISNDLTILDMKGNNKTYEIIIPASGLILIPGILYLGSTVEKAGSEYFIPMYEGRSSMARLGVQSHISAGFGDIGFQSNWTLEITVVHPLKFYPNIRIGQVYFHRIENSISKEDLYSGKYLNQVEATASQSFKDFKDL